MDTWEVLPRLRSPECSLDTAWAEYTVCLRGVRGRNTERVGRYGLGCVIQQMCGVWDKGRTSLTLRFYEVRRKIRGISRTPCKQESSSRQRLMLMRSRNRGLVLYFPIQDLNIPFKIIIKNLTRDLREFQIKCFLNRLMKIHGYTRGLDAIF